MLTEWRHNVLAFRQLGDLIGGADYKVVRRAVQRMKTQREKDRSLAARNVCILENVEWPFPL